MKIAVVIPYRPDPIEGRLPPRAGAHRSTIFQWVHARWVHLFPELAVCVHMGGEEGEINRSRARNLGAADAFEAGADAVIFADADIAFHRQAVDGIGRELEAGAGWVVGFHEYHQLNASSTKRLLAYSPTTDRFPPWTARWSTNQGNAGLLAVTREAFEIVGGYDERFTKWGWEDWAIANALETLVHGQIRIPGYVLHLNHPRPKDQTKRQGEVLWNRYHEAHGDAEAMAAIVNEPGRRS